MACDPAAAAGRVMSGWLNNSMQRRGDVRSGLIREKIERARLKWEVSVRVNITASTSVTGAFGRACRGATSLFAGQVAKRGCGQCPSTTEEKVCLRLRRPAGWLDDDGWEANLLTCLGHWLTGHCAWLRSVRGSCPMRGSSFYWTFFFLLERETFPLF